MKHNSTKTHLTAALSLGLALPALGVTPNYSAGDLLLYFQKLSGTAIVNTVYVDLGPATNFRGTAVGPADVPNQIDFIDLNAKLTTAFGSDWATQAGIYAGIAGVYSAVSNTTVVNGDISRTLYVSAPRTDVGTVGTANSAAWSFSGSTAFSTAAGKIQQQNNVFGDLDLLNPHGYVGQIVISPPSESGIVGNNPVTVINGNPTQGIAFDTFDGGVQQVGAATTFGTFGAAGSVEFALDLYRIVPTNGRPGEIDGDIVGTTRTGTYEGTFTVGTNGKVSFVTQGSVVSSPFDAWTLTFPALDTPAKRLPSADPDNDGLSNLLEFVLNGNPGVSDSPSVAPTLDASGSNFVFAFTRRADSVSGLTQIFQYGSNLTGWTDATIGAVSSVTGNAAITVSGNNVSVTVPKTGAPGGSLFGRLKVTQP
jgi:hypothetical protein